MKQASRRTKVYVGGFVVMAFGVLAVVVMFMGNDLKIFRDKKVFRTAFMNANGLNLGAPVKLGGVEVGKVDSVTVELQDDVPRIEAKLTLYEPFDGVVREGTKVRLDTQGVLGDKFVMIVPGPKGAPKLAEGADIPSEENAELSVVVAKSTDIIENVNAMTLKLKQFADGLPDPRVLGAVANNIEQSTRVLAEVMKQLNGKDSILRAASSAETNAKINSTLTNLQNASVRLASVASKVDQGQGTIGALINDTSLYDDMKSLLGRANRNRAVKFMIQRTLSGAEGEVEDPKAQPTAPPR